MSTSHDWVLRLATIAGIVVFWMFPPAVMLTLQLPDLWGAARPQQQRRRRSLYRGAAGIADE